MSEGAWLALASFGPSLAVAFAGWRTTRVGIFKDRIEMLEKENCECKERLTRMQEKQEWLEDDIAKLRRQTRRFQEGSGNER